MTDIQEQYATPASVEQVPAIGLLAQGAVFWKPEYVAPSAWIEQIPLVFWLVEALRPASVVTIGVGSGVQHLAACQAIERLRIDAASYAIGTDALPEFLLRHEHYGSFSEHLDLTAARAANRFSDNTVDLLFVDGASESVDVDLQQWLPKLSARSVLVINGVSMRSATSARQAYDRMSHQFPCLLFNHGDGAGVVLTGSSPRPMIARLFEMAVKGDGVQVTRDVFARLGRACKDGWLASEQAQSLDSLSASLSRKEADLVELKGRYEIEVAQVEHYRVKVDEFEQRVRQQLERHALERGGLAEKVNGLLELRKVFELELERSRHDLKACQRTAELKTDQWLATKLQADRFSVENEQLRQGKQSLESELASLKHETAQLRESLVQETQLVKSLRAQMGLLNDELASGASALDAERAQRTEQELQFARIRRGLEQALTEKHAEIAALVNLLEASQAKAVVEKTVAREKQRVEREVEDALTEEGWFSRYQRRKKVSRNIDLIERSPHFDAGWYLKKYADVASDSKYASRPAEHYLKYGAFEGRNPGPDFDSEKYFNKHPELRGKNINPLIHYLTTK